MRLQLIVVTVFASMILAGCATKKVLQATGGSRSDGTVELSFEVGAFEKPVIDWNKALEAATQRCAAWGYSGTEQFGGAREQCQAYYQGSCVRKFVTIPYQCTGAPSAK